MQAEEIIIQAIRHHKPVTFEYPAAGKPPGVRRGNPHVLTQDKMVHIYQTGGVSERGDLPGWRQFPLADLEELRVMENASQFLAAPDYNPDSPMYAGALLKIQAPNRRHEPRKYAVA